MNAKIIIPLACVVFTGLLPASAQYVGEWPMNEGSGSTLNDISGNNWNMTINGDANLWGYQQPGAYQFANGGYATTAETAAAGWTSGDTLTLSATFNVTGNLHDPGKVFVGGGIFAADYFIPGGNTQGYNSGAFYVRLNTSNPSAPTISFNLSYGGSWSEALPASVTDASINGGWNTIQYVMVNNAVANSMTIQLLLNGTDVGTPVDVSGIYLKDFTSYSGYQGTEYTIGACGAAYQTFGGALENVSLVATAPVPEPSSLALAGLAVMGFGLLRKRK